MGIGDSNIAYSLGDKDGIKININSSLLIKETLQKIIKGWNFKEPALNTDINIRKIKNKYSFVSNRIISKPREDFLDFINDLLNEIAIHYSKKSKLQLLHCVAYESINKKKCLVFGGHGSGKSSYLIKNKESILSVFSDDILLFSKKKLSFYSLGFPIRVRRPVKNFKALKSNALLGERLCYVFSKDLLIKDLKTLFFPDYVFEMSSNFELKKSSILNLDKKIIQYTIGI